MQSIIRPTLAGPPTTREVRRRSAIFGENYWVFFVCPPGMLYIPTSAHIGYQCDSVYKILRNIVLTWLPSRYSVSGDLDHKTAICRPNIPQLYLSTKKTEVFWEWRNTPVRDLFWITILRRLTSYKIRKSVGDRWKYSSWVVFDRSRREDDNSRK